MTNPIAKAELDEMLAQGKISQESYDRLLKAMEPSRPLRMQPPPRVGPPPRQPMPGSRPETATQTKGCTVVVIVLAAATALLVFSVAMFGGLAAIAVPNFLEAQTRSKVARAKADLRSQNIALDAYALDNQGYPVPSLGTPSIPAGLTSPVAYMTSIQDDVFALTDQTPLQYYSPPARDRWISWSVGPNKESDLDPTLPGWDEPDQLVEKTYDPTNGTVSAGDVIRFGTLNQQHAN